LKWARLLLCAISLTFLLAWTHGAGQQPAITYNITTYTACNGIVNDGPGFTTWLSDALTFQSGHPGGLIKLTVPSSANTCSFLTPGLGQSIFAGLKNFLLDANGATFSDGGGVGGYFLGGGSAAGTYFDNVHSARTQTAAKGSSCVTLITAGQTSLYNVGEWVLMGGIDPMGFGDPANPMIYEWTKVASKGVGTVCFTNVLAHTYKSTWPLYNGGDAFHSDQGGPATLYAMQQNWDTVQEYANLRISQTIAPTQAIGRDITWRNPSFVGGNCTFPTQNMRYRVIGGDMSGCTIEIDKIIGTVLYQNLPIRQLNFQSASVQSLTLDTVTLTTLNGTAFANTITNSTITNAGFGPHAYGASMGLTSVSNTSMGSITATAAQADAVNLRGAWSGGTFTVPHNFQILGSADNGSGLSRILVDSTAGYSTGLVTDITILTHANCGAHAATITVVDGTHFDVQGTTQSVNNLTMSIASPAVVTKTAHGLLASYRIVFGTSGALPTGVTAGTSYFVLAAGLTANTFQFSLSDGGAPVNTSGSQSGQHFLACNGNGGSLPMVWAVPGANVSFGGAFPRQGPVFQVLDLRQDATNTYIDTSLAGGFPTMPLSGGQASVVVVSAPQFTCVNCSGSADALDLNQAPAGAPLWSYSKRTLTAANCAPVTPIVPIWGQLTSMNTVVSSAYTGVSLNVQLDQIAHIQILGSSSSSTGINPIINAKVANATARTITPTTTSGAQSGDTLTAAGVGAWVLSNQFSPECSANIAGSGDPFTATVEFITNQGVINNLPYLLKRDLDPASNDNTPMWLNKAA
jgi:hypothetical protein